MNLEVYRNYVAIIDAGTISAASRELHIAQPALSNQLKALEAAYGTQLVERGPRHITPNNAGKILYEKARRMCQLEDAAQKEINASILGTKGTLHLGITPTWPDTNSANMILDFSNTYPEIDFDIYEENSGQLLELLEKGTIEVAVIRSAGQLPPSFSVRHTIDERLMVAFHKKVHGCLLIWMQCLSRLWKMCLWPFPAAFGRKSWKSVRMQDLRHISGPSVRPVICRCAGPPAGPSLPFSSGRYARISSARISAVFLFWGRGWKRAACLPSANPAAFPPLLKPF